MANGTQGEFNMLMLIISSSVLHLVRCRLRPGKKRRGAANATGCPTVAEQWEN